MQHFERDWLSLTRRLNWLKQFEEDHGRHAAGSKSLSLLVSLADARAYCQFEGKRLPHSYEWQYFAVVETAGGSRATEFCPSDLPAISHD